VAAGNRAQILRWVKDPGQSSRPSRANPGRRLMTGDTPTLNASCVGHPSTKHEEEIMSKTLIRVGGVAAVIAALLIVVQQVWTAVVTGPQEDLPDSIMYSSQLLLVVFGVLGIALAQQHRAGTFAQIAALVAVLGSVVWFAASLVEVTVLPSLVAAGSPLADNPPAEMLVVAVTGFAMYAIGLLLLSVSVIVTKVLPWQPAVVLGGGIILGLALESVIPGILGVYAIGLGWLGVACVRAANRAVGQDEAAPHRPRIQTSATK